jgi:hypothetical protein
MAGLDAPWPSLGSRVCDRSGSWAVPWAPDLSLVALKLASREVVGEAGV